MRTAGDGAEALRLVRSEHPDLVLMDVMMPHVDGFEACRAIKQDPSTRLIPVVLITSLNDSASRIRGIDAEALRREVARGWRRADLVATFLDQVERD